jgi:outer membrane protein TolC
MKRLMTAVLFLCMAGCSFAPTYVQPYQQLPDTWAEVSPADQKKTLERQWWRRFGDETLDALVEKALAHNRDIAQGLARVDSARAALGLARHGDVVCHRCRGEPVLGSCLRLLSFFMAAFPA